MRRAFLPLLLLSLPAFAAPITITTLALPSGQVGTPYSQTLSAAGGKKPFSWTVTSGSLAGGLSLDSSSGTIGGTPTTAGTSSFTVQVTDKDGSTDKQALTLAVNPAPLTVTTSSLPGGTIASPYSASLGAAGGTGGYTWSVASGSLPGGLNLGSSGAIGGTPTAAGNFNFTAHVKDSSNATANRALSITVAAPPLSVTTSSLPGGTAGASYSASLGASGGTGGYTWSVSAGGLPGGLTLNPSGAIGGTPTAPGNSNFTAQVKDSSGTTATKALSIAVAAPTLVITTASLNGGTAGTPYSDSLGASGGTGGYTWSVISGSLPGGLSLANSGGITGTPTGPGTSNFTAQVKDSAGTTATKAFSIAIAAPTLVITTASLPGGTVGSAYSASLGASGGTGGYTWSVSAGSLPGGLSLANSGAITGTPTGPGTSNFTAQVKDSAGTTATKGFSIAVAAPALVVTTASVPGGTVGTAYSASLGASGGTGGYTWSVSAGGMPSGLTLDPSGTIGGTPTAPGNSNFTAQVKDSAGTTATRAFSMAVAAPALIVTTASLPGGTMGTAYSAQFGASGGTGGYTWSVTSGSLPGGLSLASSGAITGTPTGVGTSNFTVQVKDSAGTTATRDYSLTIASPVLTVTTASLPNGTVGTLYAATLAASGGSGGYTWGLASGLLPIGMSLSSDGVITGTSLLPGTSNFTVQVKDSAGATASRQLSLTIGATSIVITTQSLPQAEQGVPYSQALAASGGTAQYRWSITDGALPAGLTLDTTSGRISGTPTGSTSTFTVQAADSAGATGSKSFTLAVTAAPTFSGGATLPAGALGTSYSGTATVTGGQPPYNITLTGGQLPPGLTLNAGTGEISGRPTQAGTFQFTLTARDAAGGQAQTQFTLTIASGLTVTTAPGLPAGALATAYSVTLGASGGATPYTWSATAGSLPPGLTLHSDGTIDGTPTSAGAFAFTATVTDANGAKASKDFTLTVVAGLTITTAPQLPPAVPGAAYSTPLSAAGGRPPYTWSISAGALPAGFSINSGTGTISGTTNSLGTYNFTVAVTDSANVTATKQLTLTVAPGLTFTTPASLPDAMAGTAYSFTMQASGGQTPYSWRITDGALPDGLSLNGASGAISGTPTAAGTFNFTVEVSDAGNLKGTRVHTIVVGLPGLPGITVTGVPATLAPLQQPTVSVGIASAYPVPVTGRLNLAFVPANGMPDDPSVQFSSGGRSVTFTIPANATRATFPLPQLAVQSGSVAGTIQFTVESLQAGGTAVSGPSSALASAQVSPAAAAIRTVTVNRTASGFEVQVVGLSDTRELTTATVRFRPSSGSTLTASEVSIPLSDASKAWFTNSGSNQYGGQFTLTLPFTISGNASLDSVAVVLANGVGASAEVAGQY